MSCSRSRMCVSVLKPACCLSRAPALHVLIAHVILPVRRQGRELVPLLRWAVHKEVAGPQVHDSRLADRADVGRVAFAVQRHDELGDGFTRLALGGEVQRVDEAGHSYGFDSGLAGPSPSMTANALAIRS